MTFLMFVTAAFVAVSAALKLRATARIGLGVRPLALLELLVALGVAALILPGPLTGSVMVRWAVPTAIVVLVISSVDHFLRLRVHVQAREESEGGRLATYVKYLSELPEGDEKPHTSPDPGHAGDALDITSTDDPSE